MKVLLGCEMSGMVRDAFIARGHKAISADMQLCAKPGPHHWGDVMDILYDDWDLIIAHPPCTYLANSGNKHLSRRGRLEKMSNAARFFKLFLDHPCKKICVENPVPTALARQMIGRGPDQYVNPFQFGDPYRKRTGLWLKGLPKLVPTNVVAVVGNWMDMNRDPVKRSLTFQGIANAMAAQWG